MYENIVVGFDNTEYSKAAVSEVSGWVKRHGGKFVLVHAVYLDKEETGGVPGHLEKRLEFGKNFCYLTTEKVSSEFNIEAESLVCEGDPPEVITDVASEKGADLIAMGTYGRRGLKRLLMGSTTSAVIVHSSCDVLVVRKTCAECSGLYPSVLVPFDGSEHSRNALKKACRMSKDDGSAITVLYVIPRYEEMIGFFRTETIKKSLMEEADKLLGAAREIASAEGAPIETEIRQGAAGEEITSAADGMKSDLIVMGTYGWRGVDKAIMGSTTERVIMHAGCPVLVVK